MGMHVSTAERGEKDGRETVRVRGIWALLGMAYANILPYIFLALSFSFSISFSACSCGASPATQGEITVRIGG